MKKPEHPQILVPSNPMSYTGVKFQDATTVRVPPGNAPKIGRGSFIGVGVEFRGTVVVGENCVIDTGCILENCIIGDSCRIGPRAFIDRTTLGNEVRVGFNAQVRRSIFGDGSHMDHFGYLGDALVGENVTVGAGVVTANFDGVAKNGTGIGSGSLIGVNVSLVAHLPYLCIGDNVVVAAGSVITEDVPSGSTAFGRSRQTNRER